MEEEKKRKEIFNGIFVGDTVILEKETDFSKEKGFKIGDVGIVSEKDNKESIEGWRLIDYEKTISQTLEKLKPEEVDDIFKQIVNILGEEEVAELMKKINN
jgi:hypothetical protein